MKYFFFIHIFLLFSISIWAQKISTTRVGDIKLGMKVSEIEKAINLTIKPVQEDEYLHIAYVNYNGKKLQLHYVHYDLDNTPLQDWVMNKIVIKDSKIKTLSGLGVGSTLDELIEAYKKYNISIHYQWDDEGQQIKNKRIFSLEDWDNSTMLYFYLKNDKVYSVELMFNEGCC